MSRRIHAVLFDAAGSLIRLREPVGATYAREAKGFGVDLPASRDYTTVAGFVMAPCSCVRVGPDYTLGQISCPSV